jgi:uncharacterized protein (DUF305 family)
MQNLSNHRRPPTSKLLIAALLATVALALAACGGSSSSGDGNGAGNGTDAAFIDGMVPHHESAIEMAKIAQTRGQSAYVKTLADGIVKTQASEITVMKAIGHDLDGVKKTNLGMSMKDMSMNMNAGMLKTATPFDREFVDMMIPHHQGAIRMARVELAKGKSKALKQVADDVVAAQTKEINGMNAFRKKTFGATSPAGGVPAASASTDSGQDPHAGMSGM